jgi:hypothetical protein
MPRATIAAATCSAIDGLRTLGLEILRAPGKDLQLIGRIAADKLMDLTKLDAVRYIVKAR